MSNETNKQETTVYKFFIIASGCNPNGDMNQLNRPRVRADGRGMISLESIRHKIVKQMFIDGHPVVKVARDLDPENPTVMGRVLKTIPGILTLGDDKTRENLQREAILKGFLDVRCFGYLVTGSGSDDSSEGGQDSESDEPTEGTSKKAKKNNKKTKTDEIKSMGLPAAISFSNAHTIDKLKQVDTCTITKCYVNDDADLAKAIESGSGRVSSSIGKKFVVDDVYVGHAVLTSFMKNKNFLSDDDISKFESAFARMFENDSSSARPAGTLKIKIAKIVYPNGIKDARGWVTLDKSINWVSMGEDGTLLEHLPEELKGTVKITEL